jgi:hypothetical protein
MDAALADQVRQRARSCCEYCGLPQEVSSTPFEIDHIVAEQHGGARQSRAGVLRGQPPQRAEPRRHRPEVARVLGLRKAFDPRPGQAGKPVEKAAAR